MYEKPKDHGVPKGQILLVEDLMTGGKIKVGFIEGIREAGCPAADFFGFGRSRIKWGSEFSHGWGHRSFSGRTIHLSGDREGDKFTMESKIV